MTTAGEKSNHINHNNLLIRRNQLAFAEEYNLSTWGDPVYLHRTYCKENFTVEQWWELRWWVHLPLPQMGCWNVHCLPEVTNWVPWKQQLPAICVRTSRITLDYKLQLMVLIEGLKWNVHTYIIHVGLRLKSIRLTGTIAFHLQTRTWKQAWSQQCYKGWENGIM